MDRKKILILIFALIVLVGSIFFAVLRIGDRDQKVDNAINPITQKREPLKTLDQGMQEGQKIMTAEATGSVEIIDEKNLSIKSMNETIIFGINGTTSVTIADGKSHATSGQLSDLKKGDAVKVTYDKTTKEAMMISIVRLQILEKTK